MYNKTENIDVKKHTENIVYDVVKKSKQEYFIEYALTFSNEDVDHILPSLELHRDKLNSLIEDMFNKYQLLRIRAINVS